MNFPLSEVNWTQQPVWAGGGRHRLFDPRGVFNVATGANEWAGSQLQRLYRSLLIGCTSLCDYLGWSLLILDSWFNPRVKSIEKGSNMLNGLNIMLLDFHYKTETFNWAQVTTILNVRGGGVVCVFPTASCKRANDFWIHVSSLTPPPPPRQTNGAPVRAEPNAPRRGH